MKAESGKQRIPPILSRPRIPPGIDTKAHFDHYFSKSKWTKSSQDDEQKHD